MSAQQKIFSGGTTHKN